MIFPDGYKIIHDITTEDLKELSIEDMKMFFNEENIEDLPNSKVKKYILDGKESFDMGKRINEVEKMMNTIIIDKFIKNEL